jgi:ferredoxin
MGKEDALKLRIDRDLCTGDGICVSINQEVFALDDNGLAICDERPSSEHLESIRDACNECPANCIYLE